MNAITSMPAGPADFHKVRCIRGFEAIKDRFGTYLSDESRLSPGRVDYLFFPQDEAELAAGVARNAKAAGPGDPFGGQDRHCRRVCAPGGCAGFAGAVQHCHGPSL